MFDFFFHPKGTNDFPFDFFLSQSGTGPWVMLGELNKYTTLSKQRFSSLESSASGGLTASLSGAPGERVTITALRRATSTARLATTLHGAAYTVVVKSIDIGASGTAQIVFE